MLTRSDLRAAREAMLRDAAYRVDRSYFDRKAYERHQITGRVVVTGGFGNLATAA